MLNQQTVTTDVSSSCQQSVNCINEKVFLDALPKIIKSKSESVAPQVQTYHIVAVATQSASYICAHSPLSVHPLRHNTQNCQHHSLTVIKTIHISCTLFLLIFNQANWFTGDGQNTTSTGDKWNNEQHVTQSLLREVCRVCRVCRVCD